MPERVYRLSDQAVADLNEIADYLGAQSPAAAPSVLEALLETLGLLATNPELATARDDLHKNIRILSRQLRRTATLSFTIRFREASRSQM